ncbi:MAG TPA: peptidylprolyl isomerase [Candidatus Limnocylindrales bacterium]|nr:peptidylprolyl isomerase [Candidatus Limnocylindrales bacterium]
MSPDPNRQARASRSSKKRRAVQSGAVARPSASSGGRRTADGRVRRGTATPPGGGIPGAWLAVGAVVLFAIGVLLASGTIGGGATPSSPAGSRAAAASAGASAPIAGSVAPRGTNCPTSQPPAAPAGQVRVVTIQTAKGSIEITLKADLSPIAVGNFAALAACGYYNGVVFHRVATLQDGTPFVIQGGDPTGTGTGGPGYTIQDEPVTTPYLRGTVAMARTSAPNSVGSQFFIVLDDKDQPVLAGANTYQIIGSVTKGMETADAIYQAAGGVEAPPNPVVMDSVTIGPPLPAGSGSAPAPSASSSASPS